MLDAFSVIVDQIYEAAINPAAWQGATHNIADVFSGSKVVVFLHTASSVENNFIHTSNWEHDLVDSYLSYYCKINPFVRNIYPSLKFDIFNPYELIDPSVLNKSEYYNDYWKPQKIRSAAASVVFLDEERFMALNINGARDDAYDDFAALLRRLAPHLRRAVQVQGHLAAATIARDNVEAALDQLKAGIFLIDDQKRLQHMNAAATRMLRAGPPFSATASGRLHLGTPTEDAAFQRAITEAIATSLSKGRGAGADLRVGRDGRVDLSVVVAPIGRRADAFAGHRTVVLIIVRDPEDAMPRLARTLAALYALTPAEARLLEAIGRGDAVGDYADANRVSVNTVRSQIKSIQAKTDTRRLSELVRLVSGQAAALVRR